MNPAEDYAKKVLNNYHQLIIIFNIIVQGATGTGKSYLANALVNHAIESGFTGKYYRMTELLNDIDLAEFHGTLGNLLKKLMKVDVLVIDDFLLTSTKEKNI